MITLFNPSRLVDYPEDAGVYLMKDADGIVLYVGKAKNLKKRLKQYYPSGVSDERVQIPFLLSKVIDIETIVTASEEEALLLESHLIKSFKPRYNILAKDDKSSLLIRIGLEHSWPRIELVRSKEAEELAPILFGPYANHHISHDVLNIIVRLFLLRQCSDEEFRHRTTPCILYQMERCTAPCVGKVTQERYGQQVAGAVNVLSGATKRLRAKFRAEMERASKALEFEKAAILLRKIHLLNNISNSCRHPGIFDLPRIGHREVKAQLAQSLEREDLDILEAVQKELSLKRTPRIIDCFDCSHYGNTGLVAASVGFVDGKKAPSRYRKFRIRDVQSGDDLSMLSEAMYRRYKKIGEAEALPDLILIDGGKTHLRAAIEALSTLAFPDVDVAAIAKDHGRHDRGLTADILFIPDHGPLQLPPTSKELLFLQMVRDEAHRFVITFQRKQRLQALRLSQLDSIPRIGPKKRHALLKAFQGIDDVKHATVQEIVDRAGLSRTDAQNILKALQHP